LAILPLLEREPAAVGRDAADQQPIAASRVVHELQRLAESDRRVADCDVGGRGDVAQRLRIVDVERAKVSGRTVIDAADRERHVLRERPSRIRRRRARAPEAFRPDVPTVAAASSALIHERSNFAGT
jgi:hypothetical protein